MELIIKNIRLENFKGMRSFQLSFSQDTMISGRNRSGKTTIADAITWCLFGKDSLGRSQFGIKTRKDGVEIPHLPHRVTMDVEIDGIPHSLERNLVEQWGRQNGEEYLRAHVTECMVDGQKYTVRDYQKYISDIIPEETFKILTTPTYFPNLNWESQRKQLVDIVGEITPEEIMATLDLNDGIKKQMQKESGEHLSYQIKQVKKSLDELPVRMEEVSRQMSQEDFPETLDADILDIQRQLRGLPMTGDRLKFELKRKANIEQSATDKVYRMTSERDRERMDMESQIESAKTNIRQLEQKSNSLSQMISRCDETALEQERERDEIRRKWKEVSDLKLEISEGDLECPVCHRLFPEAMQHDKIEEIKDSFNKRKSALYEELTEKAQDLKKEILKNEEAKKHYESEIRKGEEEIQKAYESIRKIESILDAPKDPIPTVEEILSQDGNYKSICESIERMGEDKDDETRKELNQKLSEMISLRERRESNARLDGRLEELVKEQSDLNTQLYELETLKDAFDAYQAATDDILEKRLNGRFKMVRFKLFKTLLNGTRQPYCEAYVGGIPYSDLNRADKINAGIDIINALSEHYGVKVPIVVDNAESINVILETKQQKIRLYVSEEKEIVIS